MSFPSHIFFNDINHGYIANILKKSSLWLLPSYMAVATYCYYEKMRRTMCTAIVSYLLKFDSRVKRQISGIAIWELNLPALMLGFLWIERKVNF